MTDFALGPFVLSADRVIWIIATLVLWGAAALIGRKCCTILDRWALRATLAGFIAARLAFVVQNADVYLAEPASILAFWQGGFTPWGGVAGFAVVSLLMGLRNRSLLSWMSAAIVPALACLFVLWQLVHAQEQTIPDGRTLLDLDGTQVRLQGPAVINLWASWCPPCRREMPMMVEEAASSPDLPILFINQGESPTVIHRYLDAESLDMTPILDPGMELMAHFGILGLPSTLFVDAQGRIIDAHSGEISRAALRRGMQKLTRQTP